MMALKALFITGSMGSKIPCHHTHPVNMAQKVIYLEVRVAFFGWGRQHRILASKECFEVLVPLLEFFPNNS
jgi:hypothetical protein